MSTEHNIEHEVLEKIRAGEVRKRPRLFFVAQVALLGALAALALALSIFALSFILFSVHESGEQFLLGFGQRGLATLIALFPWRTLALVAAMLVALEWLVRHAKFGYRVPLLQIFLGIAGIAVLGGVLLNFTPLHAFLLDQADRGELPVIGFAYEDLHSPHQEQGVFRGEISAIASTSFTIAHNDQDRDTDDGTFAVVPPAGFDLSSLSLGDRVYVAGTLQDGIVYAYGIRLFPLPRTTK